MLDFDEELKNVLEISERSYFEYLDQFKDASDIENLNTPFTRHCFMNGFIEGRSYAHQYCQRIIKGIKKQEYHNTKKYTAIACFIFILIDLLSLIAMYQLK